MKNDKGFKLVDIAICLVYVLAVGALIQHLYMKSKTQPERKPAFISAVTAQEASTSPTPASSPIVSNLDVTMEVIELNSSNTVVLADTFTDASVNKLMLEIQELMTKNSPKLIYLVLNTPGGSVDAGLKLISFIKGLPTKVKTLTIFSASMGFHTVQGLDERLILDSGTLMSHRARFGIDGEAPGEMFSRIKYIMTMLTSLDEIASKRMGMKLNDYQAMIADEYWVYGQGAVTDKAADRTVLAKCNKDLNGTKLIPIQTFFGEFMVEVAKCPLITGFISVQAKGETKQEASEYVKQMFSDKKQFVRDFVLTNKWMTFQK